MTDTNLAVKRGRGRPAGSKDSKPRRYQSKAVVVEVSGLQTVEERVRALDCPQKLSVYAAISGLSVALLRKKVEQRKINGFFRSRNWLIEPIEFLRYWQGGLNGNGRK
jgi:hypothetical protein